MSKTTLEKVRDEAKQLLIAEIYNYSTQGFEMSEYVFTGFPSTNTAGYPVFGVYTRTGVASGFGVGSNRRLSTDDLNIVVITKNNDTYKDEDGETIKSEDVHLRLRDEVVGLLNYEDLIVDDDFINLVFVRDNTQNLGDKLQTTYTFEVRNRIGKV